MKDKVIVCIECRTPFVFARAEQERYRAGGFAEPMRCMECRRKRVKALLTTRKKGRHSPPRHQGSSHA